MSKLYRVFVYLDQHIIDLRSVLDGVETYVVSRLDIRHVDGGVSHY